MTKLDWLKQARERREDNPEIEEALVLYEMADTQEKQQELETRIKQLLVLEAEIIAEEPKKKVSEEVLEQKAPEIKEGIEHSEFTLTLKDVEKAKTEKELSEIVAICVKELKYMEDTKKVKMTFQERRSRQERVSFINTISNTAKRKIYDNRALEKKKALKDKVPALKIKQLKFIELYKRGFSISNMIKLGYVKKNELTRIVEKDNKVFEELGQEFIELYNRWKAKFL